MLITEKNYFAGFINDFARAKKHAANWFVRTHTPILSATHVSDVFATAVALDAALIPEIIENLNEGRASAADSVLAEVVSTLRASDPYIFSRPTKADLVSLHYEAQHIGVFSRQGNDVDNRNHVEAAVDRMDVDSGRRFFYETRHKLDALKSKGVLK